MTVAPERKLTAFFHYQPDDPLPPDVAEIVVSIYRNIARNQMKLRRSAKKKKDR